jgi:3-oxoacyl-ACP reductase-like protein
MGIFQTITDAILGKKPGPKRAPTPAPTPAPARTPAAAPRPAAATTATPRPAPPPAVRPTPLAEVDVEQRLDALPGADKLNWRSSIVDLMKLLGVDSSFASRKELAGELGDSDYSGTAEENIQLHKRTMQELAKNGGKVPPSFLD